MASLKNKLVFVLSILMQKRVDYARLNVLITSCRSISCRQFFWTCFEVEKIEIVRGKLI